MAIKHKGKLHYAYVILLAIALQKFIVCAENTTSGLFLLPVTTALGISQGSYMLYQTVQYAVMALASMIMPRLTARFRYTTLNKIGLLCMFCGLTCMSRAQNVYLFYLAGFLDGLGLVVCNLLLMGTLIPRWFRNRMGVMMATVTLLSTLPAMVLSPVVSHLLDLPSVLGMESWRGTYLLLSLLPVTVGLVNAFFVLRERPSDMGLQPCSEDSQVPAEAVGQAVLRVGVSRRVAMRSTSGLLLVLALILWNVIATINPYLASYAATTPAAASAGFDLKGFIGAAVSVGSLTGAYLIGLANDHFGAKGGVVIGCASGALGTAAILLGDRSGIVILLGVALLGVYISLANVQLPVMLTDMYGSLDYDKLFPLFTSFGSWFGAFSASFWGLLHDVTGGYTAMLSIGVAACALAGVLGLLAVQRSKRLWKNAESEASDGNALGCSE